MNLITDSTVLIFGGTGSLGHNLSRLLLCQNNRVHIFSRDETKQWKMRKDFDNNPLMTFTLGCIRDKNAVNRAIMQCKPNIIIIAAALKHIDQCEDNINECIATNITGIQNILDTVHDHVLQGNLKQLETVVMISTDKACNPINVYGMSKSIAEKMMVDKARLLGNMEHIPKFVTVRYGNVLNSRGSLLELYDSLVGNGSRVFPITHVDMTRFFMHIDDSLRLIDMAIAIGQSGDIFVPITESYLIKDIADHYAEMCNGSTHEIGIRPGEKIHETLISEEEGMRTYLNNTNTAYIITPRFIFQTQRVTYGKKFLNRAYTSSDNITPVENLQLVKKCQFRTQN